jgi:predicted N-acyltransferase
MNEFIIEPNMVLDMDPKWKTFDDYLASMHSKYRVRARKALSCSLDLVRQSFNENQIAEHKDALYRLYQNVAEKSGFNLVNLNVNYLLALKKIFQEDFTLDVYLLDGKIVAFYTTIRNGEELEAHFLGFDQSLVRDHQIYLNILYDIVKIGIEKRVHKIVYARTALEIKSSVGARAHEMYCYMRHPNAFSNKFVAPILAYLKPNHEDWVPRQPFKDRERY